MVLHTSLSLIHANFFFVDIVGLSDPEMSTKTQIKKIEALNKSIMECDAFKLTPEELKLVLPTGDGMAIGFLQGPELPLQLAIQLQEQISEYNKARIPSEIVQVRIGLHNGNVFVVNDIQGNKNVWGPGIIVARRVMDFGDENHILLSNTLAESLHELSDEYHKIIKPVHDFTLKHGRTMLLYSAYGDKFGNPKHPTKGAAQRSKIGEEILRMAKTTLYPFVEVYLTINDEKSMRVHYKRTYQVKNISDEPIYNVLHGIATDVPKNGISDLDVKVYDENNRTLKISSINVDEPYQKEFTTQFNQPIYKNEDGRYYIMEYVIEEPHRYFENAFLINCQKMVLKFEYPNDGSVNPMLYEINQETEEKRKSDLPLVIREDGKNNIVRWEAKDIAKGQTFRIEW